jgi:hypothetical protein
VNTNIQQLPLKPSNSLTSYQLCVHRVWVWQIYCLWLYDTKPKEQRVLYTNL